MINNTHGTRRAEDALPPLRSLRHLPKIRFGFNDPTRPVPLTASRTTFKFNKNGSVGVRISAAQLRMLGFVVRRLFTPVPPWLNRQERAETTAPAEHGLVEASVT